MRREREEEEGEVLKAAVASLRFSFAVVFFKWMKWRRECWSFFRLEVSCFLVLSQFESARRSCLVCGLQMR